MGRADSVEAYFDTVGGVKLLPPPKDVAVGALLVNSPNDVDNGDGDTDVHGDGDDDLGGASDVHKTVLGYLKY